MAMRFAATLGTLLAFSAFAQGATPDTQVFDTLTRSETALAGNAAAKRTGWKALAEDVTEHRFAGDVALGNDHITLLLRRQGRGIEVYARQVPLPHPCAVLAPLARGQAAEQIGRVRILENTPSTVAVELSAVFPGGGPTGTLQVCLTTGQPIIELRASGAADELATLTQPRYVLIPNFFGHDQVFPQPNSWSAPLPADNMLVHLSDPDLMVMNVWPPGAPQARPLMEAAATGRSWSGCAVRGLGDKPLWVAVLQGKDLWHAADLPAAKADQDVPLAWRPPFEAKWRADLTEPDGFARSWYFGDAPVPAGGPSCPCRLEGGRALVRLAAGMVDPASPQARLLLFPMDRSRATPLTAMLPIDVLRNTLGVGPCQYILQTEGLSAEGNPTPDAVMEWIEKQFARKRDRQAAEEIQEQLSQMLAHMRQAQARIEAYAAGAGEVRQLLRPLAGHQPAARLALLESAVSRWERSAREALQAPLPPTEAAALAQRVQALVGKPGALDELRQLAEPLRQLGARQDRALADCRMLARRVQALAADTTSGSEELEPWRSRVAKLLEGR